MWLSNAAGNASPANAARASVVVPEVLVLKAGGALQGREGQVTPPLLLVPSETVGADQVWAPALLSLADRLKARDANRTGWASLCVMGHTPPYPSATPAGPAEIITEASARRPP